MDERIWLQTCDCDVGFACCRLAHIEQASGTGRRAAWESEQYGLVGRTIDNARDVERVRPWIGDRDGVRDRRADRARRDVR